MQHSDYGGNPFGTVDYPLIFFIPALPEHGGAGEVAQDANGLRDALRVIAKLKYRIKLNPAWTVPNF